MATRIAPVSSESPFTRSGLDVAIVASAIVYLLAIVVFRALAPSLDAGGVGPEFARFNRIARNILTPLGLVTMVLVLIALVREGGIALSRARLRIAAVALVVIAGVVAGVVIEPLEHAILAAGAAGGDALRPLLERWERWQLAIAGLGATAGVSLLVADRRPRPSPAEGASALTSRHRTLLLLLSSAALFEGYDRFIVSLALPSIARDLGGSEGAMGTALAVIRAGSILAILLGRAADRFGRRRMLLVTVVGYTLATAGTGLSTGLTSFIALQMLALAFLSAELALGQVVVAEEFPPGTRGFGQAMLGAAAAIGAGLVAILFPLLADSPLGWRGLYFVGILPLLIIGWLRRSLPETTRWSNLAEGERRATSVFTVLRPAHRLRFVVLVLIAGGSLVAAAPAFNFASYRATTAFNWTPTQVSTMVLSGGGLGFWGWIVFGRLSDVLGRRWTGAVALLGGGLSIISFFSTSYLFASFTGIVFFEAGVAVAVNSLSTEVFPTALRATAKVWITNAGIIGAMVGLALVGLLADRVGGHAIVITGAGSVPVVLAPLLFLLPETHRHELEEISRPETLVSGRTGGERTTAM